MMVRRYAYLKAEALIDAVTLTHPKDLSDRW
jgi:hypothetical protein